MILIEAIVRPNKLEAIRAAVSQLGIFGMTAVECKGFGRQMGHAEGYRGPRPDPGFMPKILLHICVQDSQKEQTIQAIIEAAETGNFGDGKIFVHPIAEVIRIRTRERDAQAV